MNFSRRQILGMLAAGAASLTSSRAFADACAQGAFFDENGKLCEQALNAPSGSASGVMSGAYYKQSDQGVRDNPARMVRPNGVLAPTDVPFRGPQAAGSIILDHANQYLYLVKGSGRARRYVICVGRDGRQMPSTEHEVFHMEINPTWGSASDPNNAFAVGAGPRNPLGVRGMHMRNARTQEYLGYMIHGTNDPAKFTQEVRLVSNGCIRMLNPDVVDLYAQVRPGARVYPVHDGRLMAQYASLPGQRLTNG